jgi:hypothetical protein
VVTVRSEYRGGGVLATFEKGGAYSGGLALVGEKGPELINFNRPGWVSTADQTAEIVRNLQRHASDNDRHIEPIQVNNIAIVPRERENANEKQLLEEIKLLRKEVENLRNENKQAQYKLIVHTKTLADLAEKDEAIGTMPVRSAA